MSFKILGTGRALPEKVVTNLDLEKIMDTSDEWIQSRTGIKRRHIAVNETTTSLALDAAKKAIEMAKVEPEELNLVIVGTVSSDYHFPSTACLIQEALGLKNAVAFDINAACSGFLYALQIADGFFSAGTAKKALIIGAEVLSKMMDWSDRGTCVLFGDGAGAAVIEASDNKVCFSSGAAGSMALNCQGRKINNPYITNDKELDYTHMDGQSVFKFATRTVPLAINDALEKSGVTAEDIDLFILHQANMRIIESISHRLKAPMEKFPTSIAECGNVSAASVPILLDICVREGKLENAKKIVMAGFGAGLTWSALVMEL